MPVIPAHEQFLQAAANSIYSQQYPKGWDVVLHVDGDPAPTLGAKINRMMERSIADLSCDIAVLVDSDDLHHPTRIQRQIQPLLDNPNLLITGTSILIYRNSRNQIWQYSGDGSWLGGLAFNVSGWHCHRFPSIGA